MSTPIPGNRARMTPEEVAAATAGSLVRAHAPAREVLGLTTDSRAVTAGCGFVAIKGPNFDGHAFVGAAVGAGAALVVVERGRGSATAPDVVEVDDTLKAWGMLARAHLRRWRQRRPASAPARTVAITGSAGKTTTKELCAALLSAVAPCHATKGNLNNRVGVPAIALGVEPEHRFAVFEVGMSVPGEIRELANIIEPDVGVLLNAGVAHAGGVGGTREDVAREKGDLFEALELRASAVVNLDDEAAFAQIGRTRATHVETFGRGAGARYQLVERQGLGSEGSRLVFRRPTPAGPEPLELRLSLLGEAAAIDLLAALAAAEAACRQPLPVELVAGVVGAAVGVSGRSNLRRLNDDILVIDDSYNANPSSMGAALATLAEISGAEDRRAVAVLGEMKELGAVASREHEALGEALVHARVRLAIGCGGGLVDVALDRAHAGGVEIVKTRSSEEGAEIAAQRVVRGDVVLLKGSRAAALEHVLESLLRAHGLAFGPQGDS